MCTKEKAMTHLSEEAIIGKQYVKTIWVVNKEIYHKGKYFLEVHKT